jgi:3-phenylpropionate/cinnamic acid dioxygenase small subunit
VEEDDVRMSAASATETMLDRQGAQWFIWREAELLDRQDYAGWLDLWTSTGLYIIPTRHEAMEDYRDVLNVAYDNQEMRRARIERIASGLAPASTASARTARLVSRFTVTAEGPGFVNISTAMLLTEYKYERARTLAADVDYQLILDGAEIRLGRKVVRLINAEDHIPTIGYLL